MGTGNVTGLYAGLVALLMLVLAWRVARQRLGSRVGLGDGEVPELRQAIRAHANLVEYAPLVLLLLLVAELAVALPPWALHALGASFVVARVLHAIGLARSPNRSFGRLWGTLLTWLVAAVLALVLVWRGILLLLL